MNFSKKTGKNIIVNIDTNPRVSKHIRGIEKSNWIKFKMISVKLDKSLSDTLTFLIDFYNSNKKG